MNVKFDKKVDGIFVSYVDNTDTQIHRYTNLQCVTVVNQERLWLLLFNF